MDAAPEPGSWQSSTIGRPCGERHLLLELADATQVTACFRDVTAAALAGVVDVIPGARTVLIEFDPAVLDGPALLQRLRRVPSDLRPIGGGAEVTVAVHYDGADLDFVCDHLAMSREAFVRWHGGAAWTVAFTGFAPGFGYCTRPDPWPGVPRLPSPRTRVPAGSVALGGEFAGVYPRASPGGWRLIGRTDAVLWDLARVPPTQLAPGATVRFVVAP